MWIQGCGFSWRLRSQLGWDPRYGAEGVFDSCTHTHAHTRTHTNTRTHTRTHMHLPSKLHPRQFYILNTVLLEVAHTHTQHTHTQSHTHTTHTYTFTHTQHTHMHSHTHTQHTHTHSHTHTLTHTHTHTHRTSMQKPETNSNCKNSCLELHFFLSRGYQDCNLQKETQEPGVRRNLVGGLFDLLFVCRKQWMCVPINAKWDPTEVKCSSWGEC